MDGELLVAVLARLEPRELRPCRGVSRAWAAAAAAALPESFRRRWGLASLSAALGAPRRPGFLEGATLESFVRVHQVTRTDSIPALALRYRVAPFQIKRVNAMISDHSLHSRLVIYIPVPGPGALASADVELRYDPTAKRDIAVVLDGSPMAAADAPEGSATTASGAALSLGGAAGGARASEAGARRSEELRAKLGEMLGRSLRLDDATARFYIDEAGGDLKRALAAARDDEAWADGTAGPIRTAPVQRWIRGEAGL